MVGVVRHGGEIELRCVASDLEGIKPEMRKANDESRRAVGSVIQSGTSMCR